MTYKENQRDIAEYDGNWEDDKKQGHGTYTLADWTYEGPWQNDKRAGTGARVTYQNGNTY